MPADLLVLRRLQDFHVVLRMDWLAQHFTMIDYRVRAVIFCESGLKEFVLTNCRSTLFVTTIYSGRAKQSMSCGCIAFLGL